MPDVKTVQNPLADIGFPTHGTVRLVMDRGFFSEADVNGLYKRRYKFLMAVKKSLKLVEEKLDEARGTLVSRTRYSSKCGLYCRSFLTSWECVGEKRRGGKTAGGRRRLYLHIYYDDRRADDGKIASQIGARWRRRRAATAASRWCPSRSCSTSSTSSNVLTGRAGGPITVK